MISLLLAQKILSLFIVMVLGFVLVKSGLLKSEDSRILSVLSLYLITPCVILSAFQIDCTAQVVRGLLLAAAAAVCVHAVFIAVTAALKRVLRLDAVEQVSVIYSNAGNLIIPIVSAVLGQEWVIYTTAYISVQILLLWSHGLATLCGEKRLSARKIITNPNILAIIAGLILFTTGLRFPSPLMDAVDSVGSMIGPAAMLVTGMLIGGMELKSLLGYRRVWLIAAIRLLLCPLIILAVIWLTGAQSLISSGAQVLLITLLASMTPSASSVTQMSQLYGRDAAYAGVINVVTTLLCIVTMPCIVYLYELI